MRVGDGDRGDAAARPDVVERGVVDQAGALPEQVADRRLDQVGVLADCERRAGVDRGEAGLQLADLGVALAPQLLERGPALALLSDVLPLVLSDRAVGRRLIGRGVLHAAGEADVSRHEGSSLLEDAGA